MVARDPAEFLREEDLTHVAKNDRELRLESVYYFRSYSLSL